MSDRKIIGRAKSLLSLLAPLVTAAAMAVYILNVLSYQAVVEASIDGVPCGYVESVRQLDGARSALESELSDYCGEERRLDLSITYSIAYARKPVTLTDEDCAQIIGRAAERDYCGAYMLRVNGVMAAASESAETIYSVIDDIESELRETTGGSFGTVRLSSDISVEYGLYPRSYLMSGEELRELIAPTELGGGDAEPDEVFGGEMSITSFSALAPRMSADSVDPEVEYGVSRYAARPAVKPEPKLSFFFTEQISVDEVIPRETITIEDANRFSGDTEVIAEGADGLRNAVYEVCRDINGTELERIELSETLLSPAAAAIVISGTKPIPAPGVTGSYIWPCDTGEGISSGYGGRDLYGSYDFHLGIDLPGDDGLPILAADGGEVVWAGRTPSYGNWVRIKHDDNTETVYAHMRKLNVAEGDIVRQGQQLGEMGHTGAAYGTHLHFEVRVGGKTVNPIKYLPTLYTDKLPDEAHIKAAQVFAELYSKPETGETADGETADGETADGKTADGKTADGETADEVITSFTAD